MYRTVKLFMIFFFVLVVATPVFAHRMAIDYFVEKDRILIEVYFPRGGAAKGVEIYAEYSDGTSVLIGETDDNGAVSFVPGKSLECEIVAKSSGHKTSATIPASDVARVTRKKQEDPGVLKNEPGVDEPDDSASVRPRASKKRLEDEAFPWERMFIGIGIIAVLTGAGYMLFGRGKKDD